MKKNTLALLTSDAAGLSFTVGGALIFIGYFWPELTGWVGLVPVTGPLVRNVLPIVFVVAIISGVGLLKKADWARQIGSAVAPLSALAFLAVAGLQLLSADDLTPVSLTARCVVCGAAAVYFGVFGSILTRSGRKEEDPVEDATEPKEEEREGKPRPARSPAVAAVFSILAGILAVAAAACIGYNPKEGFLWAPAVPFLMLMNVVGVGLGWGGLAHAEEESRARPAALIGAALSIIPILAAVLLVALKRLT